MSGSIIITLNEITNRSVYQKYTKKHLFIQLMNNIKIGVMYGLFVDAFKLGS